MKRIWSAINALKLQIVLKNILYLGLLVLLHGCIGGAVWGLIGRFFLPEIEWLICFVGYPAMFGGFFGGVLYLYNHEFEAGSRQNV